MLWVAIVPISGALGAVLECLGVPAAWILGGIAGAGMAALTTGRQLSLNRYFYTASIGFVGMLAAMPLTLTPWQTLLGLLPAAAVMAGISVGVGLAGGIALHRAKPTQVSWETGIMSMLPGGASLMPALAAEVGADQSFVIMTQYLRLLAVSLSLPLVAGLMGVHDLGASTSGNAVSLWWLALVIAAAGRPLGVVLRLPAAAVMGPLLLTLLAEPLLPPGYTAAPPEAFRVVAFLAIGWACGGALNVAALRAFSAQLPATLAFIGAVIGVSAISAWLLMHWVDITYLEAYLATSPGALETVLALSSEAGGGAEVVTVQLVRLIFILMIAGYLPQLLRLARKLGKGS
ncbi:ammonia monooxygenase [Corynebacterium phocae]|uniref:Ammonia monooxygenase n=1 Tax=Corynebacterium phocae TaxID=161895 RepID=A0A1L7D0F7_9CORY|nr:AbrB family transcriptional regulator [Corynebacterium phocae]APT91629.1 ammonia monooxygenase [Corynebacterium phocae]KAA8720707.1 AbrB family transcriptional regulator [Corynebacterium phocae]